MGGDHQSDLLASVVQTIEPLDDQADLLSDVADLDMVLRLIEARKDPSGERAHLREGGDLVRELVEGHQVIVRASHHQHILRDPSGKGSRAV